VRTIANPKHGGHKAGGYVVHVTLGSVAAGFMPACFGFDESLFQSAAMMASVNSDVDAVPPRSRVTF
jgi:hypothetical protein